MVRGVGRVRQQVGTIGLVVAMVMVLGASVVVAASDDSITTPDTTGDVGLYPSLVVDADGNPVVSYYDETNGDLKLLRCNDPNCADGDDMITTPITAGSVRQITSLALDEAGNPVMSYHDASQTDLKVLHCNDPNCADGDDSITTPDTTGDVGKYSSLVLDQDGNPVVSYLGSGSLKLLHCNDPDCAGGDESITAPDTAGVVGYYTSLALDQVGNPVVAHWDVTNQDLKVLHCNDPDCAGGDESVTAPDTVGDVGRYPSLALDPAGNPVVSYYDASQTDLKVLRCNDPNCADGDDTSTSPDTAGTVGYFTSLALDPAGNPVVSYFDGTNGDLKVLHCNGPDCAGEDASITAPDTAGTVGLYSSLALDEAGRPVVAYWKAGDEDLRVLHCDDPNCQDNTPPTLTVPDDVVVEATSPDGATVEHAEVIATDADDSDPTLACAPASGTTFPIGSTTVTCTATDDADNASEDTFTVTVVDTTAPALTDVPDDVTAEASSPDGATVDYALPVATDTVDDDPTVACAPASGTTFPVGSTTVTCTATDEAGNASRDTFTVTVVEPAAPTVTFLGDAADGAVTTRQGEPVTIAAATDPPGVDLAWDLDGDGSFDDATGDTVTFSRQATGTYPVTVQADDGTRTGTAVLSVVVRDAETSAAVLAGATRVDTAIATSRDTFADGAADAVVLARADVFADALAGTALAVRANAPLLLTPTDQVPDHVLAEIDRVLTDDGTVYVLGGRQAIAADATDTLSPRHTTRLAGPDRYATAVAIADEAVRIAGDPETVLVARGDDFPDGLAAGAVASASRGVVVLSAGTQPTDATTAFLAAHADAEVVAVGGQAAAAYPRAEPIVGADRYATATALAGRFLDAPTVVGVARGDDFPDAMTGGVHIGRLGGALLLSRPDQLPEPTRVYLCEHADTLDTAYTYGGPTAVKATVTDHVEQATSDTGC